MPVHMIDKTITVMPDFLLAVLEYPNPISQKRCLMPFSKWYIRLNIQAKAANLKNILRVILSIMGHKSLINAKQKSHFVKNISPKNNITPVILWLIEVIATRGNLYIDK